MTAIPTSAAQLKSVYKSKGSLVQRELSATLTEGLYTKQQPLRVASQPTSPYTGEAFRWVGTGHSESFLELPAVLVVFFKQ